MSFRDEVKASGLVIRWALIVIVTCIAIGLIGVYGFGWFSTTTAERRGQVGQTEKVIADPNYRIAAYDHFHDACAGIQTETEQIAIAKDDLESAKSGNDAHAIRDAQVNLSALRYQRIEAINQYNADAAKADTKGHFRSSDLPYHIDQNAETVECAA